MSIDSDQGPRDPPRPTPAPEKIVERRCGAGTWDEVPPGQGASPALSQETADTPAATVAPIPEASPTASGGIHRQPQILCSYPTDRRTAAVGYKDRND